ncbi:MAG: flagellar export protein FliJ [Nitrospirota bacterium]
MAYQSRLGAVLFQRKNNEDLAVQEFARQKNLLMIEWERLQSLKEKLQLTLEELAVKQSQGGSAEEFTLYFRFIGEMQEKVETARKFVSQQEVVCESRRVLLETAVKERKAVEAIEEKRKEAYFEERMKKEQEALDEIGGQLKLRTAGFSLQ